MKVTTSSSPAYTAPQRPAALAAQSSTQDVVSIQSGDDNGSGSVWTRPIVAGAVMGGLGVYAGLSNGILPGVAGAIAGTGLAVVATAGAARAGFDEQSFGVGMAGLGVGVVGGAVLGASSFSPVASAAILGVSGAISGGFFGLMSHWTKD